MTSEFKRDWDNTELKADYAKLQEKHDRAIKIIAETRHQNDILMGIISQFEEAQVNFNWEIKKIKDYYSLYFKY